MEAPTRSMRITLPDEIFHQKLHRTLKRKLTQVEVQFWKNERAKELVAAAQMSTTAVLLRSKIQQPIQKEADRASMIVS